MNQWFEQSDAMLGQLLRTVPASVALCTYCGAQNPIANSKCQNCGENL